MESKKVAICIFTFKWRRKGYHIWSILVKVMKFLDNAGMEFYYFTKLTNNTRYN